MKYTLSYISLDLETEVLTFDILDHRETRCGSVTISVSNVLHFLSREWNGKIQWNSADMGRIYR